MVTAVFYFIYKKRKTDSLVRKIFDDIKNELRSLKRNIPENNEEEACKGINEFQIIQKYSEKYQMGHEEFRKTILPKLKQLRKRDSSVKIAETRKNGQFWLFAYS